MHSARHTGTNSRAAGASGLIGANEDMFLQAFDSTPKLNLVTQKKLENELSRVIAIISNPSAEWDNRVQAIKHFRSLVNSGIGDQEDFHTTTLKTLEIPFQNNICDLRSQVVRETCITIAFLSCRLQQKFSRMAEILLPSLIKLIPNSAKIMSTSALVALRFIIQSTHNSRLITIIKYQLSNSKSKDIHRALCEIAERIITIWSPTIIEKHLNDFMEVLRLGICNSDELARQYARRAFNVFAEHFREPADKLFNSLDQQRQRMLNNLNHGGGSTLSMNGYGSITSNLNTVGQTTNAHSSGPQSLITTSHISSSTTSHIPSSGYGQNSVGLVSRLKSSMNTSSAGTNGTSVNTAAATSSPSRIRTPTARSTSAIDVNAQRRAKARAVYLSSMYTRPRQQLNAINSPARLATTYHQHQHYNQTQNHNSNQPTTPSSINGQIIANNHSNHNIATPSSNHYQQKQQIMNNSNISSNSSNVNNNSSLANTPNVAQQQHQLQQLQQQQAASAEKKDGAALSNAASYLLSTIKSSSITESQIVATIKYFNSLIEKHPSEIVSKLLPELMPPLVIGIDNTAICVRKASVFAMVAVHSKVGLKEMDSYLTGLTLTQKKLLEVYIKKSRDENRKQQANDNNQLSASTTTAT